MSRILDNEWFRNGETTKLPLNNSIHQLRLNYKGDKQRYSNSQELGIADGGNGKGIYVSTWAHISSSNVSRGVKLVGVYNDTGAPTSNMTPQTGSAQYFTGSGTEADHEITVNDDAGTQINTGYTDESGVDITVDKENKKFIVVWSYAPGNSSTYNREIWARIFDYTIDTSSPENCTITKWSASWLVANTNGAFIPKCCKSNNGFVISYPVDNGSNKANIKSIIYSSTVKDNQTEGLGIPSIVVNEFTVNTTPFNYYVNNTHRVGVNCDLLTSGNIVYVWCYNNTNSVSKFKAQITDINGISQATEFEIDDNLKEYITYRNEPRIIRPEVIKMNTPNKFIVVWTNLVNNKWVSYRQQFQYNNSLITATNNKLSVGGNSLNPPNTNHTAGPAVGVFSDDSYVISFQYYDVYNWNTSTRIFLSNNTQDPETTNLTPNSVHDGGGSNTEGNVDVVVFSNNDFLVTFQADNRGGASGSDIYSIYFTYQNNALGDSLIEGVARPLDSYILFDNTEYFIKDIPNKTITLKKDMNWQTLIKENGGSWLDYIDMTPNWIFDGGNNNIIINDIDNGSTTFKGLFKVISSVTKNTRPTIKNFTIKRHELYPVILEKNCGYIIRSAIQDGSQNTTNSFIIENCTTNSNLSITNNNCGGICGSYISNGGDVLIKDCTNNIDISSFRSGGICGANPAYNGGNIMIINCINNGKISGEDSAGIISSYFNSSEPVSGSNELVTVTKCTNTGEISGKSSGGIFGARFRNSIASYCINSGVISGTNAGGIFGGYSYSQSGGYVFSIRNCTNSGEITGTSSGGFLGNNSVKHGDIIISNCKNTGNVIGNFSGGFFGREGCIGKDGSLNSVIIKNSYCSGQVGVDGGNIAGGFFGDNSCGNGVILTIQDSYYKGDVQNGSALFCSNFSNGISSSTYKNRINISSCYFIATGEATSAAQAVVNVDNIDEYWTMLISHCYISGFSNNGFIKTSANSSNIYTVISNCYSVDDVLYNLGTTSETNDQYIVYNSYSRFGNGNNPKTGTNGISGIVNGNFLISDINSSFALENSYLNSQVTLSTLQSFPTLNSTIWTTQQPKQNTLVYTYDSAILLTCFQNNPWSSYTSIDSDPVLGAVSNSNNEEQVIKLFSLKKIYNVGNSTFSSGNQIISIFNNENDLDDWFNGVGENPNTVKDISLVDDIPILKNDDYPSVNSKSFVTKKSSVTILEDSGNKTYVFSEELGNIYNITYNGNNYILKFIFYGSGGLILSPEGGESGGDPHIIPVMQPSKVLTLPCNKHCINYNYLNYSNGKEKLTVNIMTWLVEFKSKKNNTITDQNILEYIKKGHSYIRYVMINYQNGDQIERVCFDLTKLRTVDYNVNNFEKLAYLCKLPFRQYETYRIEISDTYNSNNNKIIKYKTKNTPQKNITIYMDAAKFVLIVGIANNNIIFNNYIKLKEYPKSLLTKGSGLLVSCKNDEMQNFVIESLKSL